VAALHAPKTVDEAIATIWLAVHRLVAASPLKAEPTVLVVQSIALPTTAAIELGTAEEEIAPATQFVQQK
jgi:hypothetical protein